MNLQKSRNNTQLELVNYKKEKLTFYGAEIKMLPDTSLTDLLNKRQLDFINSINYKIIKEIPEKELKQLLFIIISNNLRALQSKMKAEDQVLLVNDFYYEIINDYFNFTIKEIEIIISSGVRDKFNTGSKTLSIVSFNMWVKAYKEYTHKINKDIQTAFGKLNIPDSKVVPVTEKSFLKVLENNIKADYEAWCNSERKGILEFKDYWMDIGLIVSANYVYGKLIEFGLIKNNAFEIELSNKIKGKTANDRQREAKRIVACKYTLSNMNPQHKQK